MEIWSVGITRTIFSKIAHILTPCKISIFMKCDLSTLFSRMYLWRVDQSIISSPVLEATWMISSQKFTFLNIMLILKLMMVSKSVCNAMNGYVSTWGKRNGKGLSCLWIAFIAWKKLKKFNLDQMGPLPSLMKFITNEFVSYCKSSRDTAAIYIWGL